MILFYMGAAIDLPAEILPSLASHAPECRNDEHGFSTCLNVWRRLGTETRVHVGGLYPKNGESNGKENGELHGNCKIWGSIRVI